MTATANAIWRAAHRGLTVDGCPDRSQPQRASYDGGRMPVRRFMEAPQDGVAYGSFVGILTFLILTFPRVQRQLRERDRRERERHAPAPDATSARGSIG